MDAHYLETAKQWAENTYFDQESRDELNELIKNNNHDEITNRFYKDLEFGTGGLRSILGFGRNRINKYTIRKATQALANTLNAKFKNPKVAISYDSRIKSDLFAHESAAVLSANGIKCFVFDRLNPVPLLSFSVRHHDCQAGIMVTASHNPPQYNGYKVYWSDGAQVTPPHDQEIIDTYKKIENWSDIKYHSFQEGLESGLIQMVGIEVENAYHEMLKNYSINPEICREHGSKLSIVYTPIHGTGLIPCSRALDELGLSSYQIVQEQEQPDGTFPTVSSPNPEDKEALDLATKLMLKTNADITFGTDPDTDRLGVVINDNNNLVALNGNQIAVLLLDYILGNMKEKKILPQNPLVIKTIVTSELQNQIAKKFNAKVENTLTGFKWIGHRMTEIENNKEELQFIFGSEESYGYLSHPHCRDKDGVNALALVAEMALCHKLDGKNLVQALDALYEEYGFSYEDLLSKNYEGKEGAEKIERIMNSFREFSENSICGEEIESISDYSNSSVRNISTGDTQALTLPTSNVIGFQFKSGNKLFLRPSGTEPKIKFYTMVTETEGSLEQKKEKAYNKVDTFRKYIVETIKEI